MTLPRLARVVTVLVTFALPVLLRAQATGNGESELRRLAAEGRSVRAMARLAARLAERGEAEEALDWIRRARDLAPNTEALLATEARLALDTGRPVLALVDLEALVRMIPEEPEYPYLLGVARLQAGDMSGAIEALERARTLDPARPAILVALGLALDDKLRYAEALAVLRLALELAPDDVNALAGTAEAELGLGDVDAATRSANDALARDPRHPLALLVAGSAAFTRGDLEAARRSLQAAAEVDPRSEKARYQLALVYSRLGDPESAEREFARYREIKERNERDAEELEGFVEPRGGMG